MILIKKDPDLMTAFSDRKVMAALQDGFEKGKQAAKMMMHVSAYVLNNKQGFMDCEPYFSLLFLVLAFQALDAPSGNNRRTIIIIVVSIATVLLALVIFIIVYLRVERTSKKIRKSLHLDFETIRVSTDGFLEQNKLGEGGFGSVYKGRPGDEQCIAVKRLSSHSKHGDVEFKNEVLVMAKLHHRNLVKLIGFCLQQKERLLIYEYVPNGSLDQFLFDRTKSVDLDWETRFKIIGGISKGLLHLHEDAEMNPKISDFGLVRLFILDQTHSNTSKVVGTFGYMAPEYAMHGQFSFKSDVFSFVIFGVICINISLFFFLEREDREISGICLARLTRMLSCLILGWWFLIRASMLTGKPLNCRRTLRYEGTVWDYLAHGKGVYVAEQGLVRYEGEWLRNNMEDHGVVEVDIPDIEPVPGSKLEEKMWAEGHIISRDFMSPEDREWFEKDIEDSMLLTDGNYETPWYESKEWIKHFGSKP